jgi:tripartite-type tricarboxylate transporter receptor subunit TctC
MGEISMLHVPYKTTGPALMDVIAGRVSMMFADFTTSVPHVKAGTVRPLAISRIQRSSLYPDLPTMDEAGVKGFNLDATTAAGVPAGATRPAQHRATRGHRQPGQLQERRLRGIFQHA